MSEIEERDDREWELGWDGHNRAQQRRLSRLSLAEKLAWLEEAQRLQKNLEESRRRGAKGGAGIVADGNPADQDPKDE